MLMPQRFHRLRNEILYAELLVEPCYRSDARRHRRDTVKPASVTGKLRAIADDGAVNVGLPDRAIVADDHIDNNGEPVFTLR
jgi:hypothetical protein